MLSWKAVGKGTTSYQVQDDNSAASTSPEFATGTENTKAVATSTLVPGKNYWRIRAAGNGKTSGPANEAPSSCCWSPRRSRSRPLTAQPKQPQSPPLLQWSSSQGAVSYTIEVDGDADLLGAKVYTARTTSFVVTDPLTIGDWYWRVTATKDNGLTSLPSAVTASTSRPCRPHRSPTRPTTSTKRSRTSSSTGRRARRAQTDDVQVALDDDLNNIALNYTERDGTRFPRPTTLNSDRF